MENTFTPQQIEKLMNIILERLNNEASFMNEFEYDGNGDTRIFLSPDHYDINVHAPTMGKKEYTRMEKKIAKFEIKRDFYSVYVWNDISGYDYWKEQGKKHYSEMNYIMVTLAFNFDALLDLSYIFDFKNDIDYEEMYDDMINAWDQFNEFNNIESVDFFKYGGE